MTLRLKNLPLPFTLSGAALFCFVACAGLRDQEIVVSDEPNPSAGAAGKTSSSAGQPSGDAGAAGTSATAGSPSTAPGGAGGTPDDDDGIGGLPTGGAPMIDGAPTVDAVTPADGAKSVTPTTAVRLDFSEALDEATVTAESIQIKDGSSAVAGALTYQAGSVLFTPAERHSLLTKYTVNVGTGVTDAGGTALEAPFGSSFSTRDGAWQSETSFASVYTKLHNTSAEAAMDGRGNALVAWTEDDGNIYVRWYDGSTDKWGTITPLEKRAQTCGSPHVAVAANGNAVVMFSVDTAPPTLWARRYVAGAWETVEQLVQTPPANNRYVRGPRVLFDGDAILAAWTRQLGSGSTAVDYIDVASAGPTGAWKLTEQLEYAAHGGNKEVGYVLNLAGDGAGNAMLAYGFASGSTTMFPTFMRYTAATKAWTAPAPVRDTNAAALADDMDTYGPVVALNPAGDAMMTWVTQVPGVLNVVASRFTRTGGWEAPVTIEQADGNGFITPGSVAAHGSDFTVVWKQIVGSSFNAYRNTYDSAKKAWGVATLLSSGDTNVYFGEPNIIGDRHGNALVAWSEGGDIDDKPAVTFARFDALTNKWSAPGKLTTLTDEGYSDALLTGSANGTAGALLTTYKDGTWTGQRFNLFH